MTPEGPYEPGYPHGSDGYPPESDPAGPAPRHRQPPDEDGPPAGIPGARAAVRMPDGLRVEPPPPGQGPGGSAPGQVYGRPSAPAVYGGPPSDPPAPSGGVYGGQSASGGVYGGQSASDGYGAAPSEGGVYGGSSAQSHPAGPVSGGVYGGPSSSGQPSSSGPSSASGPPSAPGHPDQPAAAYGSPPGAHGAAQPGVYGAAGPAQPGVYGGSPSPAPGVYGAGAQAAAAPGVYGSARPSAGFGPSLDDVPPPRPAVSPMPPPEVPAPRVYGRPAAPDVDSPNVPQQRATSPAWLDGAADAMGGTAVDAEVMPSRQPPGAYGRPAAEAPAGPGQPAWQQFGPAGGPPPPIQPAVVGAPVYGPGPGPGPAFGAPPPPTPARSGGALRKLGYIGIPIVVVAIGALLLYYTSRPNPPSYAVNTCVKQVGDKAEAAACGSPGSYRVVSRVAERSQCPDATQPIIQLTSGDAATRVVCLTPSK